MNEESRVQLNAIIEGRVQGVGFRYFVYDHAHSLGVTGWVRNRWDGSVEVVAEGLRPELDRLIIALRRGPRAAFVTDVHRAWKEATGEFTDFQIIPTAG